MAIVMAMFACARTVTHWTKATNSAFHAVIRGVAKVIALHRTRAHAIMATKQTHKGFVCRNVRTAVNLANVLHLANALVVRDSNYTAQNVLRFVNVAVWTANVLHQIRVRAPMAMLWTRQGQYVNQDAITHVWTVNIFCNCKKEIKNSSFFAHR